MIGLITTQTSKIWRTGGCTILLYLYRKGKQRQNTNESILISYSWFVLDRQSLDQAARPSHRPKALFLPFRPFLLFSMTCVCDIDDILPKYIEEKENKLQFPSLLTKPSGFLLRLEEEEYMSQNRFPSFRASMVAPATSA